ncbi:MAG: HPr family phosphocarrier protein [Ruminococcus sp.]|nr:HPr family phosphocarrier protein [Ruminococcus sp.]
MKNFSYTITDHVGVHTRPAGMLVKAAKPFSAAITLTCDKSGKTENAKNILQVMSLGLQSGDSVSLTIDGTDESDAAAAIQAFFEENL